MRTRKATAGFELIQDDHPARGVQFGFLRRAAVLGPGSFVIDPSFNLQERVANDVIGTLLHGTDGAGPVTLWIPRPPEKCTFDKHDRPRPGRERAAASSVEVREGRVTFSVVPDGDSDGDADGDAVVLSFVRMTDPHRSYFDEIAVLSPAEQRTHRVSEWFLASSPASIWDYLVRGEFYDPRASHTTGGRFRCQQCAYAWWYYLQSLGSSTGKGIYGALRDEVAHSVLLDMDAQGAWRHGYWSPDMETHARFHLDGIDLLLYQHAVTGKSEWLDGARRGMRYVLEHLTDRLSDGLLWFLHDNIEGERNHRIRSRWLGKDPANSLCLNTHLQALRVLHRLGEKDPAHEEYAGAFRAGMGALRRVLAARPADPVYRPLMREILDSTAPIPRAKLVRRARRRLLKGPRRRLYWRMQQRYPRLAHPNGFIERDLTLSCGSDRYHVSNVKDLLKLYELTREGWLKVHIVNGFGFLRRYLAHRGIEDALRSSPYYIEVVDIMVLYSRLVEPIPSAEIDAIRAAVRSVTGADTLEGELSWAELQPVAPGGS